MKSSEIFDGLVKARQIEDIEAFQNPSYKELHDPNLLPDIDKAISRIKQAKENGETVAVYGDYDVDGITATALLYKAFEAFGMKTANYIPDRFVDGYGLGKRGLDDVIEQGASLVITVDCGSNSEEEIAYAKSKGLDVIVTDHHEMGKPPISAIAVINTKRQDSKYPFSERSGAGIAFALVHAMSLHGFEGLELEDKKDLAELAGISTIADIVPLNGENRILAYKGIERLRRTRNLGLLAIMKTARVRNIEHADEETISFRIGPRLNASGRVEKASLSLEALITKDERRAKKIAIELERMNSMRQGDQLKIFHAACEVADETDDNVLVLSSSEWSHGINGIVASKLVERYGKPAFVMQDLEDGTTKGSGRSFDGYSLAEALEEFDQDLLISGGGHEKAAGATIKTEDVSKFRQSLNGSFKKRGLKSLDVTKPPTVESEHSSLAEFNLNTALQLESLKPYGEAHPEPRYKLSKLVMKKFEVKGEKRNLVRGLLVDSEGNELVAFTFRRIEQAMELFGEGAVVDVWGALRVSRFRSQETVEFFVEEIKAA